MMTSEEENDLESRIAARAFQIWIEEGQPYGRQQEHWELAKHAIALEDGQASASKESAPHAEPITPAAGQSEWPPHDNGTPEKEG